MKIRCFRIDDEKAVIDLWMRCNLVVSWNDPAKDIMRKITFNPELFLVGEINSTLMATVMAGYDGHRGWINYLAVCPAHRGHGFGKLIMDHAEDKLAVLGCAKVNLQIRASNCHARAFYTALGYREDNVISLGKRLVSDL